MTITAIAAKDAYKVDHRNQYPDNMGIIYANFTARSGSRSNINGSTGVIFIGLQKFILEYLIEEWNTTFFNKRWEDVGQEYHDMVCELLNLKEFDISHVKALHTLGYLPLIIKALPEGVFVPYKVPMLTIKNTHRDFGWVVNMIESVMSCELWAIITSATTYAAFMKNFYEYAELTGADKNMVPYQAHDFSMRGMMGRHAAYSSGMAAILAGSKGTDTIHAITYAKKYYGVSGAYEYAGSIPATEHSVMCAGGKLNEFETYHRLLTKVYPTGNVGIVSDTWDLWNVVDNFLPKLKDIIKFRGGRTVIRPDSGYPPDIICGTIKEWFDLSDMPLFWVDSIDEVKNIINNTITDASNMFYYVDDYDGGYGHYDDSDSEETIYYIIFQSEWYKLSVSCIWNTSYDEYSGYGSKILQDHPIVKIEPYKRTSTEKGLFESLWDIFGGTINDKGFKVLDDSIGCIYGDSITLERQEEILKRLHDKGFSIDGLFLGVGSYSLQYVTRDTHGMAMKSTGAEIDGVWTELFKDPVTDDGIKKSAKGWMQVHFDWDTGDYFMIDQCESDEGGVLVKVFEDGVLLKSTNIDKVRGNVRLFLNKVGRKV